MESARISVSTGTAGGVEPAPGDYDPPTKETFDEDVDFDIKYQQNGRVTGTATNKIPMYVGDKPGRAASFDYFRNRLIDANNRLLSTNRIDK